MLLDTLAPVLEMSGVGVVPLHARTAGEERWFAADEGAIPIAALAAVMSSCDLVVTVDTMAAHLAGALAVPTCLMLHAEADWRWMEGRTDSPWYPTATLYRQPRAGDWRTVVDAVRARLLEEQRRAERQRA
jgi:ADP-heptose:LPS heptosyltransferase